MPVKCVTFLYRFIRKGLMIRRHLSRSPRGKGTSHEVIFGRKLSRQREKISVKAQRWKHAQSVGKSGRKPEIGRE